MSISVQVLPTLNVIQISVDGGIVFIRRELCTEFMGKFMTAMAESIPDERKDEIVADVLAFQTPDSKRRGLMSARAATNHENGSDL